jgi:hypothetical protein
MMSIVAIARPAPLTRQPMLPSSFTYERPAFLGRELGLVLLVGVAERVPLGVAEARVVVEVTFASSAMMLAAP